MTIEPREANTTIARLVRVQPDLLEIHYHPGCVFITEHVAEAQAMRRELMGDRMYGTLTVIPEDADFDMEAMRTDHAEPDRTEGQIIATAVVAKSSMIERLTHVYFKFFPQLQRVLVTDNEDEARAWMTAQLEEISNTGS